MRTVLDCLSGLAVSAAFNSPNAMDHARAAIDEYLERGTATDPIRRIHGLCNLRDAFRDLKMDTTTARQILSEIEARIFDALASPWPVDERTSLNPPES